MIDPNEWSVFASAAAALGEVGIDFMIGGALGLGVYTGRLRDTKDVDFFVVPEDCPRAVEALAAAGFADYYPTLAYDRGWIYRSTRDNFIIDLIFQMANRRAEVDLIWFERSHPFMLKDKVLKAVAPEELLWQKLYVLQRDRCDWPDILNLLSAVGSELDWEHLRERLEQDVALLRSVVGLFIWLSPLEAAELRLPDWLLAGLEVPDRQSLQLADPLQRVALLDSRAWYRQIVPADQPLAT